MSEATRPPFDLSDLKEWLEGQPRDRMFDARSYKSCPVAAFLMERFEADQVAVCAFTWSVFWNENQVLKAGRLDYCVLAFIMAVDRLEGDVSVEECLRLCATIAPRRCSGLLVVPG